MAATGILAGATLLYAAAPAAAAAGITPTGAHLTSYESPTRTTGAVATFTSGTAGTFTATITWGDGTAATAGTVSSTGSTAFRVAGSHTYAEDGHYVVTTTITDPTTSATATVTSTATVQESTFTFSVGGPLTATEGTPVTATLATFTDPGSTDPAAAFTATVAWGDGATSPGTIVATGTGRYKVIGTHTYAAELAGSYDVSVTEPAVGFGIGRVSATVTVDEGDVLSAGANQPFISTATGSPFSGTVAVFEDSYGTAVAGDLTATIHWGDGTSTTGTVSGAAGGPFDVAGTHSYASAGRYAVTTTIADATPGTAMATATTAAAIGATATSVSSSANPQAAGSAVTYTATVSPTPGGGTVSFADNGSPIASCRAQPVVAGHATCTVSYAAALTHAVQATYSGDAGSDPSTSPVLLQTVITVPGKPIDVSAVAGDGAVTLSWAPPSSDGGSPITGYDIYEDGAATPLNSTPVLDTNEQITTLANGTKYSFTVEAVNAAGNGAASAAATATPTASASTGYWVTSPSGHVTALGGAPFDGDVADLALDAPIVGMAADPATGGYWLVASDGGVFGFDAPFDGSMGGKPLNAPIVGMAADPATGGYWLVASDGGVFGFDAPFDGSMGGTALASPITGAIADPKGRGYWLTAGNGTLTPFGAVPPAESQLSGTVVAGSALSSTRT